MRPGNHSNGRIRRHAVWAVAFACVFVVSHVIAQVKKSDDLPLFDQPVPEKMKRDVRVEPLPTTAAVPGFTPSNVNVSNLNGNESEVSIAVNPTNPDNLVICGHAPNFANMNTFFTMDGGETWTLVPIGNADDGEGASCTRVDPTVAFDDDGVCYVSYFTRCNAAGTRTLLVARSDDGGQTYTQITQVADETDGSVDKEIIGTGPDPSDPSQQNVYLAYRLDVGSDVQIHVATSTDGGATFSDVIINDESISGDDFSTFGMPAVGPNGEVYVVWDDQSNNPTSSEIMVDVSFDGGANWGTDVSIGTTGVTRGNSNRYDITAQPDRGVLTVPSIAADRSGGPNDGRVYVAYTVVGGGGFDDTDVVLRYSDDNAQTWSSPLVVNDDGGSSSQFLPWVTVDNCGDGKVAVAFLDTRNDPDDEQVQAFLAVSEDGGVTVEPNLQIASGQSDQSTSNPNRTGNNYLEYIGVSACGDVACLVWPDNSANLADLDFFSDCACLSEVTLNCPSAITVECEETGGTPASNSEIQAFLNGVSGSGCGGNFEIENDAPSFFEDGTTKVTFTATDLSGNETTCSADVTVEDTTDPTVSCPDSITVECASHCGTPVDDPQLADWLTEFSATDICDDDLDVVLDTLSCFPLGTTEVTYTATDDAGNTAACTTYVTVEDTTPPEIYVEWNRYELWPPNHKMVDIQPDSFSVTDVCDDDPMWVLEIITSDEPDNGKGDGNTVGDIAEADTGTTDVMFQLRSERQGKGDGRKYTIIYRAWDESGNVAQDTSCITVPHDQGHPALAAHGFAPDGTAFADGARTFNVVIPSTDAVYAEKGNRELVVTPEVIAEELDVSRAYVGNTGGVLKPSSSRLIDVDGDGRMDLVLTYRVAPAAAIPTGYWASPADGLAETAENGSLGLHFTGQDGTPFLVSDVFALGAPITLREEDEPGIGKDEQPIGVTSGNTKQFDTDLASIYPNPFNPETTVRFTLAERSDVKIAVYDVRGALVKVLVNGSLSGGEHTARWNGLDSQGRSVASGVYFARMVVGGFEKTRKMVMLK